MRETKKSMGKKERVIEEIFRRCQKEGQYCFHNNLVKEVSENIGLSNYFDATKWDTTKKLPKILREHDYFIIHLGGGYHRFMKGIKYGFHTFEGIQETKEWRYKQSLLNEVNTSESNILSLVFNQELIHDFLYKDSSSQDQVKVYGAHRTGGPFSYSIGKERIKANKVQIEIDFTMERGGVVSLFECKNKFLEDFAIYQIYLPFLHYHQLKGKKNLSIKKIECCYLLREGSRIRIYKYGFENTKNMSSIKLSKSVEYNLVKTNARD